MAVGEAVDFAVAAAVVVEDSHLVVEVGGEVEINLKKTIGDS